MQKLLSKYLGIKNTKLTYSDFLLNFLAYKCMFLRACTKLNMVNDIYIKYIN